MIGTHPDPVTERTRTVVGAAYSAFARRDIPALLALLSPDVVWGEPDNPLIPSAGIRHGVAGVMAWLQIGNETEDIEAFELQRLLVDGDMAAAIGKTRIVARSTGKSYEMDFVHLVTVRDDRIVQFVESFDTWLAAEAFRAD